mgnify:CR=1 FL=1
MLTKWKKLLKDATKLFRRHPKRLKATTLPSWPNLTLKVFQYFHQRNYQTTRYTTLRSWTNNTRFTKKLKENLKESHIKFHRLNANAKPVYSRDKWVSQIKIIALRWSLIVNMTRALKTFKIFSHRIIKTVTLLKNAKTPWWKSAKPPHKHSSKVLSKDCNWLGIDTKSRLKHVRSNSEPLWWVRRTDHLKFSLL